MYGACQTPTCVRVLTPPLLTGNFEKFLLYLLLGLCAGLVLFLVVVVGQLLWERRRAKRAAKTMHDPLTSVFAAGVCMGLTAILSLFLGPSPLGCAHAPSCPQHTLASHFHSLMKSIN